MNKRLGIVLASRQPQCNKIVLLDQEYGKCVCVPDRTPLSHGMLLSYCVRRDGKTEFLYTTEVLALPVVFAAKDLLFFHHLMELCDYFLPHADPIAPVFDLLQYLYNPAITRLTRYQQYLFLCKFFTLLGIYPDEYACDSTRMSRISCCAIDRMLCQNVDLNFKEAELSAWLLGCVMTHPYKERFKTTHFLTQSRGV